MHVDPALLYGGTTRSDMSAVKLASVKRAPVRAMESRMSKQCGWKYSNPGRRRGVGGDKRFRKGT